MSQEIVRVTTNPVNERVEVKVYGGGGSSDAAVLYIPQTLTLGQKTQTLANVGIAIDSATGKITLTAPNGIQFYLIAFPPDP